ncbi:MAG: MFS transporter [Phycisphaerales bacterium]|jgi:MFS family permease|nr:MFS transporter [Phycisphaerales bacterium]
MPHRLRREFDKELAEARKIAREARADALPWLYWAIAASFYLYEFFARVAPSVMEGTLQKDFAMNASGLGFVMGLYYLAYAPMQLVVGITLDRFGSKKLLSTAAIIAGVGCLAFALAESAAILGLGRIMLGIGSSFAYVGAVYVATVWFPRRKLAFIMGMTAALGTLGAALGQAPLEVAVQDFGWRSAMYTAALGGLVIAILIWLIVPRRPDWFLKLAEIESKESKDSMFAGLREVVSNGQTWLVSIISLLLYVPLSTFGALWGDEYVATSAGVSKDQAAWAITMLFLGFAAGGPLLGWLSDKYQTRRLPMLLGGGLCAASMGMLLLASFLPFWLTVVFLILSGFFAGAQAITFATAVEQHSSSCKATAVAFVNFFVMLGGFILQPAFGAVLDITSKTDSYTASDYRMALVLLPISLVVGTILCRWLIETDTP